LESEFFPARHWADHVLSVLMIFPYIGQSLGFPLQGRLFEQFAALPWLVVFGAAFVTLTVLLFARGYFKRALKVLQLDEAHLGVIVFKVPEICDDMGEISNEQL